MFERFTDRSRKIVILSQEEVKLLGGAYIGTEYLVLAMLHDGEGLAARVLNNFGVTYDGFRDKILELRTSDPEKVPEPTANLPFTPGAVRVLRGSENRAADRNDRSIRSQHILLELLARAEEDEELADGRTPRLTAVEILALLGVDIPTLQKQLHLAILNESPETMPLQTVSRSSIKLDGDAVFRTPARMISMSTVTGLGEVLLRDGLDITEAVSLRIVIKHDDGTIEHLNIEFGTSEN